ncbi:MAG: GDP-mannose 4,6-dehydratase [Patescibacteria group bacterium]
MNKKILITGISGFVGNYLARLLVNKEGVRLAGTYHSEIGASLADISSNIELYRLDLMDFEKVVEVIEKCKPDEIYHLAALASAAKSFENPSLVVTNNITSQLNLLEAVRKGNINPKIMIISSAEVYGIVSPSDIPVDEQTPLKPASPYAISKIAQDYMGLQYNISYNLNIIRVRPFNHIGPGQTDQFATSAFAKKVAEIESGKREPILTVGNLEAKRDFTNVKDMVRAYVLLMEKGIAGEVYNIGSGKSYKMSDVLNILLSFSNAKIKVEVDPKLLRPSDNPELLCDNTKFKNLTNWTAEISIEKTLEEILEFWRKNV